MTLLFTILIIGVGTYLARLSFIAIIGDRTLPAWAAGPLRYVTPAVFAALIAPAVLVADGTFALNPAANPRFLAAVLAALAAWRFRNVLVTIGVGMAALWIIEALV